MIAITERLSITTILTTDRRHFSAVRPSRRGVRSAAMTVRRLTAAVNRANRNGAERRIRW
ncbi:hypothetical protein GCM10009836_58070 [Pseudonocardia ailaonensis]|uniref:PIN domain-containing protein n=1 Tax=Pseudonocardia ailaonensis TaxID=367279 RepID=A0ABN2NJR5_9PSEU